MTNFQEAIHIHYQKKKHGLLHEPARNADSASSDDDLSRLKKKGHTGFLPKTTGPET